MPEEIKQKLRTIWTNQAGAYDVAKTIYELWWDTTDHSKSFINRCSYKYEEAPYDEYE